LRIVNADRLTSVGNRRGRKALVRILEAGLHAGDPYGNVRELMHIEGRASARPVLTVGHPDFEPNGTPHPGQRTYNLSQGGRVYVVGAGKGVQYLARPLEDLLGDHLTGGHVIAKHGDPIILDRISVTLGGHPVPDEGCVRGCQAILALLQDLREEDLVITLAANGVSSLLTCPVPTVSLEDVARTTHLMQIERGAPTHDLNPIRNHLDIMKGGRISRYIQPAKAIHIIARDPDYQSTVRMSGYRQLMYGNFWLHTLPDCTTFAQAREMLHKWDAWDAVPASVRAHLERADPAEETVKAAEFEGWDTRVYGVLSRKRQMMPAAMAAARELGFSTHLLARHLHAEASQVGRAMACIAKTIQDEGMPFAPPCALFSSGELLVTVGEKTGIGGRNQEYVLGAAFEIAGTDQIVMGGVDSDGTDGPGGFCCDQEPRITCLAGGIVDGQTVTQAKVAGVDIWAALQQHNTSQALWKLDSGIAATPNIAVGDLGVTLVLGRSGLYKS
jgi:glycerate-2-kinase